MINLLKHDDAMEYDGDDDDYLDGRDEEEVENQNLLSNMGLLAFRNVVDNKPNCHGYCRRRPE